MPGAVNTPSAPAKPDCLEDRFTRFLSALAGSEVIDDLELPTDPMHRRKADFLLARRQVIVELKTLTEDTSHKIESLADKHRDREEWPLFYGKADVRKVLSNLPDGDDIYAKMANAIGRSVEAAVRSAEEQITHTRHVLDLPDAAGLLVILNESIDILDPKFVGHRVAQLMRRQRTGRSAAERIDFACLLFESHAMEVAPGLPASPFMLISGGGKERFPWFPAFHQDLVRRWAEANGGVTVEGNASALSELQFTSMSRAAASSSPQLPRHEVWRMQYRSSPYLRPLTNEAVLAKGADLLNRLRPHFLKGGPGYVAEVVNPLMEEFTHFLEEMNFRGLDMRNIPMP